MSEERESDAKQAGRKADTVDKSVRQQVIRQPNTEASTPSAGRSGIQADMDRSFNLLSTDY